MRSDVPVEMIPCPFCRADEPKPWAVENGFTAVKCTQCRFIYVNPRPAKHLIDKGVETGHHEEVEGGRNVVGRRSGRKLASYQRVLGRMFNDVWSAQRPVSWLDIGAGFGEVVEAVVSLAPQGSRIAGIEPMGPKAKHAQSRGLNVREGYLQSVSERFEFVSLIHVFSHLPDFRSFVADIRSVLKNKGEFYMETGNIADLQGSEDVPTQLDLPDHLVFAGECHIDGYLNEAGFEIVDKTRVRRDTVINFAKQVVHKLRGRQVGLVVPYTSQYRSLQIRARLK